MELLVLGGTAWLGGSIAAAALDAGHAVTCAARGTSGAVPPGVRLVRVDRDRDDGLAPLLDRGWDAIVDVARQPGHVRRAARDLADRARRFVLVSSGNVYLDHSRIGEDETAAVRPPLADDVMPSMELYGEAKVACEQAVRGAFGDERSAIVRSGLIAGPGDPTGRSSAWPLRFAHPVDDDGRVVVPEAAALLTQLVDVRDLAVWILDLAAGRASGVLDAVGDRMAYAELLATARRVAGHRGDVVAAPDEVLERHGVGEWAGAGTMPLWLHDPEWVGFAARAGSRARTAGLALRPLERTLADALVREHGRGVAAPRDNGTTPDQERSLLAELAPPHAA